MFENLSLLNLDRQLFYIINKDASNSLFDLFFPAITDLHKNKYFIFVAVAALCFWIWRGKRKAIQKLILLIVVMGLTDLVAYHGFKKHVPRLRPSIALADAIVRAPVFGERSFPSNHASNMFALATFMSFVLPQFSFLWYGWAFLIAYSRVYCGVHYPGDVIAGAILGYLISKSCIYLFKKFFSKQKKESH